ncbi:MAG: hypothetical protein DWQ37_01930 [Planctomycetota bacterium]|nr:MAG: hypothetical protein DWQ37_01930 [Planctomycetota bacterium]
MTVPQGLVSFPGVAQVLGASITLGHGISPSTAQLRFAPQPGFATEVGTLTFTWNGFEVRLPDCKVDRGNLVRNESGEVWQVSLVDRRWKWRFGHVSGRYNVRRSDATVQGTDGGSDELVVDTERTPQQLAEIYLEAMGETAFDVSPLPNDARPPVDHDYDNPAQALGELCDHLGCRVVLRLDNSVALVPVGVGGELPAAFLLEDGPSFDLPEKPDRVAVVCGPSDFQVDFPLEAVGLDAEVLSDGSSGETIKPIEQLSYRPAEGWAQVDVPNFFNLGTGETGEQAKRMQELAAKSVFRYYRIRLPVNVPGYDGAPDGRIAKLEQVLPLFEEQVSTARENGARTSLPAAVFGVWHPGLDEHANTQATLVPPAEGGEENEAKSPFYTRGFTIDAARGLVIFDEPVYANAIPDGAKVAFDAAKLVLRAKCQVRDAESLAVTRHVRERSTGNHHGTGCLVLKRDELTVTHVPQYDPSSYAGDPVDGKDPRQVTSITTNLAEINEECDRAIDRALASFERPAPRQVRAAGIVPVELDGAISSVSYQVGAAGATTTVTRNSEPAGLALGYRERRAAETSRRAAARRASLTLLPGVEDLVRRAVAGGRRAR